MNQVTPDEVKRAVLAAGITWIDHHDCSICGWMVGYTRVGEQLYFDPRCDCTSFPEYPRPRSWQSAADWINMQIREDIKAKIMARFGFSVVAAQPTTPRE